MSQDQAMRARVDGKQMTRASIVWEFRVGSNAVRCRRTSALGFVMEMRSLGGWEPITHGANAEELLRKLLAMTTWSEQIERAADIARTKP